MEDGKPAAGKEQQATSSVSDLRPELGDMQVGCFTVCVLLFQASAKAGGALQTIANYAKGHGVDATTYALDSHAKVPYRQWVTRRRLAVMPHRWTVGVIASVTFETHLYIHQKAQVAFWVRH